MGPVQKAMGWTLFIALKHGADPFFVCSLQPCVGYFFPLHRSQWEDIYWKNAVAAIFFTEIADSVWNAVAPIEVNWKKKKSDTARSQYSEWIFFDDSTYEKNTIYRNIKYFVS